MRPVFLIGFMGTGKTTLGRALAAIGQDAGTGLPGLTYLDLDDMVEAKAGMSVREIFSHHGEAEFRKMESETLREAAATDNVIVGCGGGTPCHSGNMEWMNSRGLTVWLRASDNVLLRRLTEAQEQRPLLAGMDREALAVFIAQKQLEREPWYSQAAMQFDSDRLETEQEIADSCRTFLAMCDDRLR